MSNGMFPFCFFDENGHHAFLIDGVVGKRALADGSLKIKFNNFPVFTTF
jgi:hypothetical protein